MLSSCRGLSFLGITGSLGLSHPAATGAKKRDRLGGSERSDREDESYRT
jgi:hypothetical protein